MMPTGRDEYSETVWIVSLTDGSFTVAANWATNLEDATTLGKNMATLWIGQTGQTPTLEVRPYRRLIRREES